MTSPIKVLIVDDSPTYRRIVRLALGMLPDVTVSGSADTGKITLDFLRQNPVDLVTLDVVMPEMDGLATLKEIKKQSPETNVVMVSGAGDETGVNRHASPTKGSGESTCSRYPQDSR